MSLEAHHVVGFFYFDERLQTNHPILPDLLVWVEKICVYVVPDLAQMEPKK